MQISWGTNKNNSISNCTIVEKIRPMVRFFYQIYNYYLLSTRTPIKTSQKLKFNEISIT